MKKIFITTPENIEIEYRLAGVGSRIVAGFLDYLIQGILYFIIFMIFLQTNYKIDFKSQNSYYIAIIMLILAFINYGYFTVSEMVMDGRTLGKKVLGLRAIRKNGQPMDIKHSLVRNLLKIFVDNYMIGIIMMFFRKDESRIGDILSSTMVIEEEKEKLYLMNLIPENIKNKLDKKDEELLMIYLQEKDEVWIDEKKLEDRILNYFKNKYDAVDEEVILFIEKEIRTI
ncbi:RDD family protein [Inediibacterium massiliense]|uniref:RDD family protein n=1 Tax=Inediibacterium massiliense TaxID=1658111 RepID=UPI0006B64198|nr:RDD family protein [Inediibacterium massiliense]